MSAVSAPIAVKDDSERLLEALLPIIHDAVSRACYHYSADQYEIEDVCHR